MHPSNPVMESIHFHPPHPVRFPTRLVTEEGYDDDDDSDGDGDDDDDLRLR